MFDLDGTLGCVRGGDGRVYVEAVRAHLGPIDVDMDWSAYSDTSDSGITRALFREHRGREPTAAELASVRATFRDGLDAAFRSGAEVFDVVPGAHDALRELPARHGWHVALATGGWESVQEVKLARGRFDLAGMPAAYSEQGPARESILRTAVERAADRAATAFRRVVYVGDAPWDVRTCARLGWPFVGIGSGPQADRLRGLGASHVLPDFSDVAEFVAALARARVPSAGAGC